MIASVSIKKNSPIKFNYVKVYIIDQCPDQKELINKVQLCMSRYTYIQYYEHPNQVQLYQCIDQSKTPTSSSTINRVYSGSGLFVGAAGRVDREQVLSRVWTLRGFVKLS